jgi:cyclopropane fatty-acyl-phospholipid synthase-like methyltransferase
MATRPGWTRQNLRHVAAFVHQGRNPAARVYESIGSEFFLAPAPGWLNLGLWDGPGSELGAERACRRLVRTVASALPTEGVILDVGNGLGTQDPVIADVARPRTLVAVNITEWQLRAGRSSLRTAGALPVAADATRLPLVDDNVDGVISVEAAFHFSSRLEFFRECVRALRPGGVLTTSDISTERMPRGPRELAAGLTQLRVFGLRRGAAMTAEEIADAARSAGLVDVDIQRCGDRVIAPAIELTRERLSASDRVPIGQRQAGRVLLGQVDLMWRRGIIDYVLFRARKPEADTAQSGATGRR